MLIELIDVAAPHKLRQNANGTDFDKSLVTWRQADNYCRAAGPRRARDSSDPALHNA
jgi:hypothetical protein